jgi:hypothetical protein
MTHSNRSRRLAVAALTTLVLTTAGPSIAGTAGPGDAGPGSAGRGNDGPTRHQHTVKTVSLRGSTFACGTLLLRITHGRETETTDGDQRGGVVRVSISRVWHGVRLHGSDGRTYRASTATVAWFVLQSPDLNTPVHGLEVGQVMFRGGPDKSPGWLREQIKWTNKHETDNTRGPCTFGD